MRNVMLIAIALAAGTLIGGRSAHASYYDGPWCGVFTLGPGVVAEKCDYRDFETCRMDIIAGNRGFCRVNGYYLESHPAKPHKKRKHVRH
jgi:hypothetical protein